jgi:hypothetical protein
MFSSSTSTPVRDRNTHTDSRTQRDNTAKPDQASQLGRGYYYTEQVKR